MWYLKRLDVNGKLEQLIACEFNSPKFNNAYKLISKERHDFLLKNFQNKQINMRLPSNPKILEIVI